MKSILFASTALVAFAGAAAAQGVTLTGNAEMGIFGATDVDVQFHTDVDVTFTMSGETDNGLTFGASVDLDEGGSGAAAVANDADDGGATIFLSGSFGTITMGDTDGALDWAVQETLFNSGSLGDNEEHIGYNGNSGHDGAGGGDGQIARYDYSFSQFSFAVSAEQAPGSGINAGTETIIGVGAKAALDLGATAVNFGLGFQTSDVADVVAVSVDGSFGGGFRAGLSFMDFDAAGGAAGDFEHIGVGVGYSSGAIAVSANYGMFDRGAGVEASGFGLTAGYDLGGGAVVQFGYGYNENEAGGVSTDFSTYSFGVRMNF